MKKLIRGFGLLTFMLCLCSCSGDHIRARAFVENYNKGLGNVLANELYKIHPGIINQTEAKVLPAERGNEVVGISIYSRFTYNSVEINFYKKMVPPMFAAIISSDKNAKQLIENGGSFKVAYYSRNKKEVEQFVIDKKKLTELLKEDPKRQSAGNPMLNPAVKTMLTAFNNSLPIVMDAKLQVRMLKVEVNPNKELVYVIEVGKEIAGNLKNEAVKQSMRNRILSDGKLQALFERIRMMDLHRIRYIYQDKAGRIVNEILFNDGDFAPRAAG